MKFFIIIISIFMALQGAQKPLKKVSIQLQWLDQFQFAGYYIAKEKGFYKDVGLDVEIKKYTQNTITLDEVVNDRATFGIGRSDLIWLYSAGEPISLISSTFQSSPYTLLTLKSSGIKRIKDFAGKKIMLQQDAINTASVHAMLHSANTNEKSLIYKKHTFNLDDLIDAKVDIYAAYISNEPYVLQQKGIEYNLFSPKDKGFDFYSDILFTSTKVAKTQPKLVKKFKNASIKGWKYAFNHIDEAVEIIYKKYNTQHKTRDALKFEAKELKKLAFVNNQPFGSIDKKKMQRIFDVYRVLGFGDGSDIIEDIVFDDNHVIFTTEEQNYLAKKNEINICVPPASLPFSAIENGEFIGIGADILELVKDITNVSYKLIPTKTWNESVYKAIHGECDLVPFAEATKFRKKYFNFTTPYYSEPLVVVTRREQKYILDIGSVLDKEFSVVKGSSYISFLKKRYPTIKLNIINSTTEGFLGVEHGKYYGHIGLMMNSAYILHKMPKVDLKIAGQFSEKVNISFAVRADDKILFNIYEKISRNLKTSDLQNIFNSWVKVNYLNNVEFKYLKESIFFFIVMLGMFYYRHRTLSKKNEQLSKLQNKLMELNKGLELKVKDAVGEMQKKDTYLLHQSRLVQMGEMMSMIGHQWKQPLSSIAALNISVQLVLELEKYDLSDKSQREDFLIFLTEKLGKIGLYTNNLSQIITDFSRFYKPNLKEVQMVADHSVEVAYGFIKDTLDKKKIKVEMDLNSTKKVMLHENQFIQVILNLLSNAKEQIEKQNIQDPKIWLKSYDKKDGVVVEISDNGGGIDEDIIDKIFDPYFSTKLEKNGTGLGLHMSKSIIQEHHHGMIYVDNTDVGAKFTIEIKSE